MSMCSVTLCQMFNGIVNQCFPSTGRIFYGKSFGAREYNGRSGILVWMYQSFFFVPTSIAQSKYPKQTYYNHAQTCDDG